MGADSRCIFEASVFFRPIGEEKGLDLQGADLDFFQRKFEAIFVGLPIIVATFVDGGDVLAGGFGETLGFVLSTKLLKIAEGCSILFALAAQTGFLDREVVELALVGEENSGFDEMSSDGGVFLIAHNGH